MNSQNSDNIQIPQDDCLVDKREIEFDRDPNEVLENIWSIGGKRGWYYLNWLWAIRGFLDQMIGGVGLRKRRGDNTDLKPGDPLDLFRVLVADKKKMRLLLQAEMKLPGDAWLEFKITPHEEGGRLKQTSTFNPDGLSGRICWYALYPIHVIVFQGMIKRIAQYNYS